MGKAPLHHDIVTLTQLMPYHWIDPVIMDLPLMHAIVGARWNGVK
jgi:hypothetical protein